MLRALFTPHTSFTACSILRAGRCGERGAVSMLRIEKPSACCIIVEFYGKRKKVPNKMDLEETPARGGGESVDPVRDPAEESCVLSEGATTGNIVTELAFRTDDIPSAGSETAEIFSPLAAVEGRDGGDSRVVEHVPYSAPIEKDLPLIESEAIADEHPEIDSALAHGVVSLGGAGDGAPTTTTAQLQSENDTAATGDAQIDEDDVRVAEVARRDTLYVMHVEVDSERQCAEQSATQQVTECDEVAACATVVVDEPLLHSHFTPAGDDREEEENTDERRVVVEVEEETRTPQNDTRDATPGSDISEKLAAVKSYADYRVDHVNVLVNEVRDASSAHCERLDGAVLEVREQLAAFIAQQQQQLAETAQWTQKELLSVAATAAQSVSDAYDSLAGAVNDVKTKGEEHIIRVESRLETECKFLTDQLASRIVELRDQLEALTIGYRAERDNQRQETAALSERLTKALAMELLPPSAPMSTEGTKMRLLVTVECPSSNAVSKTVLLPVSSGATIGMLKREVLRRAVQQSIIPASMHTVFVYSRTVVILDGIALFEDDTLDDIGIAPNDKLSVLPMEEEVDVQPVLLPPQTLGATEMPSGALDTPVPPALPPASANTQILSDSLEMREMVVFLNIDSVNRLDEQESMERRLMTEMARMELEPLRREEELKRIGILKAAADKLRITLLDRATYSHNDYERRVARGALDKMNDCLGANTSPAAIVECTAAAKRVLSSLSRNDGEDERVSVIQATATAERHRKERLIEDIKDLIFIVKNQLRIPPHMYIEAESNLFAAERTILLAPSTTVKEVDQVHRDLAEFVEKLKTSAAANDDKTLRK